MKVSRKPMIMMGGHNANPKSLIDCINSNIPQLLVGTNRIKISPKMPLSLQEAFDNVIEYVKKLRNREINDQIRLDYNNIWISVFA